MPEYALRVVATPLPGLSVDSAVVLGAPDSVVESESAKLVFVVVVGVVNRVVVDVVVIGVVVGVVVSGVVVVEVEDVVVVGVIVVVDAVVVVDIVVVFAVGGVVVDNVVVSGRVVWMFAVVEIPLVMNNSIKPIDSWKPTNILFSSGNTNNDLG